MEIPYTNPQINRSSFNCPHCDAFSNMRWNDAYEGFMGQSAIGRLKVAICLHCDDYSLWIGGEMIYPVVISVVKPNRDLPEDIKEDYLEASSILVKSPRGSAAILRLAIEKLVNFLSAEGKDLNLKIGDLVTKGLNPKIQKALDIVRVTGNSAVHPGKIDLKDNVDTARKMFPLVNIIADEMISKPNEVEKLFIELVPDKQKEGIVKRDLR